LSFKSNPEVVLGKMIEVGASGADRPMGKIVSAAGGVAGYRLSHFLHVRLISSLSAPISRGEALPPLGLDVLVFNPPWVAFEW